MRRPLCNGKPETAPSLGGKPFILCWRCTGAVIGLAIYLFLKFNDIVNDCGANIYLLFLPAILDFFLNEYKKKTPSNKLRFVTGIMLGFAMGNMEMFGFQIFCNIINQTIG